MSKTHPFPTRNDAYHWGGPGRVLAEDQSGGWWALGAVSHPGGVDTFALGCESPETPHRTAEVGGFPPTLKKRHVFATPDSGGSKRICIAD